MAKQAIARFLPSHRRAPNRSPIFFLLGGLALLALCFFASHLPTLQQLTNLRPFGGNAGESGMTSSGAATPHHELLSEAELLRELVELAKADKLSTNTMEYGTHKRPVFKDDPPLLVKDLPQEHVPSYTPSPGEDKVHGKRLVVVGDVHGQLTDLKALLHKIGFDHKHGDHLVLAGDMVTKGPDSKGVVELAMALGASAVRGNQDDRVLAAARELHRWSVNGESGSDYASEAEEADGDAKLEIRKNHAHRVAKSLSRAQLAWLRSLPIILRIGHLPDATSAPWNASTLTVVHGGLVPGVHLEKQDPWAVMNMRSLKYPRRGKGSKKGKQHSQSELQPPVDHDEGQTDSSNIAMDDDLPLPVDAVAVPIDTHDGEPWSHAWNRYQNHLPPHSRHTTLAIYGHDAKAGLQVSPEADISPYSPPSSQLDHNNSNNKNNNKNQKKKDNKKKQKGEKGHRYAYGLDTGCGHGRQLTALVIEAVAGEGDEAGRGVIRHRIEQVHCTKPEE